MERPVGPAPAQAGPPRGVLPAGHVLPGRAALPGRATFDPALLEPRRPDLTFDAFADSHLSMWLRYAHLQIGARDAEHVVRVVSARLRAHWSHALGQDSVARYAWMVLKAEIHAWLEQHALEPAFVHTSAFLAAVEGLVREEHREPFEVLQDALGLYGVIARLPERQYDVVVLRYVLRAPLAEVCEYVGIDLAMVHIQTRHARRKIAAALGLTPIPEAHPATAPWNTAPGGVTPGGVTPGGAPGEATTHGAAAHDAAGRGRGAGGAAGPGAPG